MWLDRLCAEGFQPVSALTLSDDGRMRLLNWKKCAGAVQPLSVASLYVFLDRRADTVIYVGKAGKGWSARRPQHNGGYGRAHRGCGSEAYRQRIAAYSALLAGGAEITVLERAVPSPNLIDAEEAKLICKLRPRMNVKGKC